MVKTYELRTKDEKALIEELAKLKAELAKARIGKVAAAATQVKASKILVLKRYKGLQVLRKDIARVLTIINEKRREKAMKKYKKKKFKPLDQRAKRTRAARRKLTLYERTRKTQRQIKKLCCNPVRRYALEA